MNVSEENWGREHLDFLLGTQDWGLVVDLSVM